MLFNFSNIAKAEGFSFRALLMPGEVILSHADYEKECSNCHGADSSTTQPQLCLECHKQVKSDIHQQLGFHGRLQQAEQLECKSCHSDHLGRQADIVKLDSDTFDHQQTDFQLVGRHAAISCNSCHRPENKYSEAPGDCLGCHQSDDKHKGALGEDCQSCHSTTGWVEHQFDHNDTQFPLLGKHQQTFCSACHPDQKFVETPTNCFSCHAVNDVHGGNNGKQCNQCHQASNWQSISFDHNNDTDFKLEGRHEKLVCGDCHQQSHQQSAFDKKLSTACVDCHQQSDPHFGNNGRQCDSCHSVKSWGKVTFDHSRDTHFALQGKHGELACETCHRDGIENSTLTTACIDCHQGDDRHQGQQGRQCDNCHNATAWNDTLRFNHDLSEFPLVGMHAVTSCDSCHSSKVFSDVGEACVDCHQQDDAHQQGLGSDCGSCHNPNDWRLWLFDHQVQTHFPLQGAHQGLSCNECHSKATKGEVEQSSSCGGCHLNDDVHKRRFGRNCERCHSTDSFKTIRMQ